MAIAGDAQTNYILYRNAVVEKRFSISAIERNWNTISAICDMPVGV